MQKWNSLVILDDLNIDDKWNYLYTLDELDKSLLDINSIIDNNNNDSYNYDSIDSYNYNNNVLWIYFNGNKLFNNDNIIHSKIINNNLWSDTLLQTSKRFIIVFEKWKIKYYFNTNLLIEINTINKKHFWNYIDDENNTFIKFIYSWNNLENSLNKLYNNNNDNGFYYNWLWYSWLFFDTDLKLKFHNNWEILSQDVISDIWYNLIDFLKWDINISHWYYDKWNIFIFANNSEWSLKIFKNWKEIKSNEFLKVII